MDRYLEDKELVETMLGGRIRQRVMRWDGVGCAVESRMRRSVQVEELERVLRPWR